MIRFSEEVEIAADRARVWRALTVPAEVVCWDTGIVRPLDAPADYPVPGQHVRWRYCIGKVPLTLHDRPSEVEPCSRLRSSIRLGPFDFDEIYTLTAPGDRESATRLEARLTLSCRTPVLGGLLERLMGEPLARGTVQTSLAAIREHCERPSGRREPAR